jgi:hypothetical protein
MRAPDRTILTGAAQLLPWQRNPEIVQAIQDRTRPLQSRCREALEALHEHRCSMINVVPKQVDLNAILLGTDLDARDDPNLWTCSPHALLEAGYCIVVSDRQDMHTQATCHFHDLGRAKHAIRSGRVNV